MRIINNPFYTVFTGYEPGLTHTEKSKKKIPSSSILTVRFQIKHSHTLLTHPCPHTILDYHYPSTMSSTAETFTLKTCGKIDKLTEYNYLPWSSSMKDHFDAYSRLSIVLGEYTCPPKENDSEYKEWKKQDAWARATIKGACIGELRNHIERIETSAEMWKILESYANSATSIKGRARLANHFDRLRIAQGKTVSEYIGELTAIRDQLSGTDQEISDRTFKNKILKNLPPTYSTVKAILEYREIPATTQEVIEAIKNTEAELRDTVASQNTAATSESALYTNELESFRGGPSRGGSFRGGSFRGRGAFTKRFDNRNTPYPNSSACYVCGKRGHRASDCFHNQKSASPVEK